MVGREIAFEWGPVEGREKRMAEFDEVAWSTCPTQRPCSTLAQDGISCAPRWSLAPTHEAFGLAGAVQVFLGFGVPDLVGFDGRPSLAANGECRAAWPKSIQITPATMRRLWLPSCHALLETGNLVSSVSCHILNGEEPTRMNPYSRSIFQYSIRWASGLLLIAAVGLRVLEATERMTEQRPNLLLIVGDDMGYADVGFHGCRDIPTPHLDALAASGIRCTQGYVTGPYCSPTRAALLTGRYQTRFGHEFNPGGGGAGKGLPLSESTLADRLREAGYRTGLVGKWHLGNEPERRPMERGFDEFFGFLGGAHSYFEAEGILRGNTPVAEIDYTTDAFGREGVEFIERHAAQPWFLYLAFNAVHTPMHATDDRLQKLAHIADPQRRKYAAMMSAMDDAVGLVMAKLREKGLIESTLVAFISDNGGPVMRGVSINGANNEPLRGSKRTTLEGGIRVPFLVSWPSVLPPGTYEHPVVQLDLHATMLAASQTPIQESWKLDGENLLPYFTGERTEPPHSALYWRFGEQMAIRSGDWKWVRYDLAADETASEPQSRQRGVSPARLYHLKQDIHEDHDLSEQHPAKVLELQQAWDRWNQDNIEPLWGGDVPQAKNPPATKSATTNGPSRKKRKQPGGS